MPKEKGYQGWTNYETWSVKLWMNNDPGSHDYWAEAAQEEWDNADHDERTARDALTERLKDEHDQGIPADVSGVYSDLITAALQEVNWDEIADSLLEDVKDEEEEEEDED